MAQTITLGDSKDVAAILKVHPKTIWRLARNDPSFPRGIKITDGCTRWDLNAVQSWVASRAGVQR